jgi:anaerobic ribonucleoside-triphosphate reductase activating protein|nr:MAG TPA: anaerobic ribonucleoside-triphosphate reductase activating protein [Crassvirales sp.]
MLKYVETAVTFSEIPDEITLCINISNCPCHCKGCHSSYLAEDIGNPLNKTALSKLLENNKGVSCVSFMGGDNDPISITALASWVKTHTDLKVAWYSGRQELNNTVEKQLKWFDYIKLGPYIEEYGPLNSKTTNQRLYEVKDNKLNDITYKLWRDND